ncbi:MAG: TonB-dependent receptor, partial [Acidobacteriota bacterium]
MGFSVVKAKVFSVMLTAALSVLLIPNIFAQGTTGVHGTVQDKNGATVPGATVTLSNPETGFTRSIVSDANGSYNFAGLQPATYRVEVTASGFKKLVNNGVKALVDSPNELNLSLEPGDVSAVVEVTSNTIEAVVNTQDASLGNNFEPRQITQLPTDLRRVADLLTLQPGVTRQGYVAGGRSDQANIILDGVDINDQQNGGRTSQFQTSQDTVLRSTAESVEEFRITTTNANANQGRSSGAQISLVTKPGSNNLHGAIYYFYRPTGFSANDFFNNAAGSFVATDQDVVNGLAQVGAQKAERPSLARHVYGGAIGGPIIKDKLFFFYAYEGQNQKLGVPTCSIVPLAHMGQGSMKFTGWLPGEDTSDPNTAHPITVSAAQFNNIFSSAHLNPAAVAVFANAASKYAANDTTCGGDNVNTGGFRFNSPTTTRENTHIARFDWNINSKQTFFVRLNKQFDVATGASAFPDTPQTSAWIHPYGFVVGHDWTLSPNMVNNFRYGLTRQSFSTAGDSDANSVSFRFVFSPVNFSRTLSRITPTQNFTDDFIWTKGKHTIGMGMNIRLIKNQRVDFANAYDSAVTNPSFYEASGQVIDDAFGEAGYTIAGGQSSLVQNAATALIGRFSQYSGNFTFDINGNVVGQGIPTERVFATEEYEPYAQDQWKPFRNLTVTFGLRYSFDTPVYEKNGFQVVPVQPLGEFFDQRKQAASLGLPYNGLITFQKGGKANNAPGFYNMDWRNWQPSFALAWSPDFKHGFLKTIFGGNEESVIRGGFRKSSDHFGEQLAVSFDGLSSIGFTSSTTISANTYNVTDNLAPLFTGFGQNVRVLPGIPPPAQRFSTDVDPRCLTGEIQCPARIESSLDATIKTPTHYTWNISWGRRLPGGLYVEASYIGRKARHLLAAQDVNALNDLVDPQSGTDWYAAARQLSALRSANTPIGSVGTIPFFEHFFPNIAGTFTGLGANSTQEIYSIVARDCSNNAPRDSVTHLCPTGSVDIGGFAIQDWTFVQDLIDDIGIVPNLFFHPQYAAFSAFSSVAKSDFNGATFSVRQRLGNSVTWDFNYTWAKSFDDASGLQTDASFGPQFILNSLRPEDNYSFSDFDVRNSINANFVIELPFGKGRKMFSDMNKYANAVVGGWQVSGIYRWNSGLPLSAPFDAAQWATNWNAQSAGTLIRPIDFHSVRSTQNVFKDPQAALNAFRNALPGETGQRNVFRGPGYSSLDM